MELNKCVCVCVYIYMKIEIEMFFMIFQSSMGLGKSRCDIPSGITQGQDYPFWIYLVHVLCVD